MEQFSFDFVDLMTISQATETVQPQADLDPKLSTDSEGSTLSNTAVVVTMTPNTWSAATPSFADALDFLDKASGLSKTARRDLRSALISAAKILGRQPRDIQFSVAAISGSALTSVPKLFEIKVQRRRNIRSGLRKVAVLMGLIPAAKIGSPGLMPEWAELWDDVGINFAKHQMTRFARFCSDREIRPRDVTSTEFSDFANQLPSTAIISNQGAYLSKVARVWRQVAALRPELKLPAIKLPRKKKPLKVPQDQFTTEFRTDLERFRAALSPVDIGALHDDLELSAGQAPFRPNQPLKPSTVNLRLEQLGYAAGALVHSGRSPQSIKILNDLFTPVGNVKTIVRHLRERGSGQRSSYVAGIIEALRQAARFCEADTETQAELARLKAVVNPKQEGVVAGNRDRLRAMIEPKTRAIILALPELLMDSARESDDPFDGARRARVAVALELLIVAAPRVENLNRLDIEKSFRRAASGKREITHLIVDALDVKNGVPIERQLPAGTAKVVQLFLDRYRQYLAKPGCNWLFSGEADKPLSRGLLRKWITRAIRDFANVDVHPHLFRHFCAWLHLQYHPGDYEGVRRLLGHKRVETSIKSYIAFEQDIAAVRFDEVVLMERRTTRVMAKQALKIRLCFDNKNTGKSAQNAQNR